MDSAEVCPCFLAPQFPVNLLLQDDIICQGYLSKLCPLDTIVATLVNVAKKSYRSTYRYYVLRKSKSSLDYYASEDKRGPVKGSIDLRECKRVRSFVDLAGSHISPATMFAIDARDQTYYLSASCESFMCTWAEKITAHLAFLASFNDQGPSLLDRFPSSRPALSSPRPVFSSPRPAFSSSGTIPHTPPTLLHYSTVPNKKSGLTRIAGYTLSLQLQRAVFSDPVPRGQVHATIVCGDNSFSTPTAEATACVWDDVYCDFPVSHLPTRIILSLF